MRKYRTVIELVTEAEDRNEATDIAGEYLRGTLSSGIYMKCTTKPVSNYQRVVVLTAIAVFFVASAVLSHNTVKDSQDINGAQCIVGINACQPVMETSRSDAGGAFKDKWQEKETEKAIEYIKK